MSNAKLSFRMRALVLLARLINRLKGPRISVRIELSEVSVSYTEEDAHGEG